MNIEQELNDEQKVRVFNYLTGIIEVAEEQNVKFDLVTEFNRSIEWLKRSEENSENGER